MNKPIDHGPLGPIFQTSLLAALIGFGIYFDRAASAIPPGVGDAASSRAHQARVAYMQPEALSRHAPSQREPDQTQGRDPKASCAQPSREPATEDPS